MPETKYMKMTTRCLPARLRHLLHGGLLAVAALTASACVYRVPIQQGNFLETKDIDQVTVGMTQAQVRYVLGTPMVVDPFSKDRWDYVYYLKKGQARKPDQRHFVVYFDNGAVSRIERLEVPKA
jgi:outer membrane protein assembly factor BamE